MERVEFPKKLVNWHDIALGVGQVVFHSIFDHHHHENLSEHPKKTPEADLDPHHFQEMLFVDNQHSQLAE